MHPLRRTPCCLEQEQKPQHRQLSLLAARPTKARLLVLRWQNLLAQATLRL